MAVPQVPVRFLRHHRHASARFQGADGGVGWRRVGRPPVPDERDEHVHPPQDPSRGRGHRVGARPRTPRRPRRVCARRPAAPEPLAGLAAGHRRVLAVLRARLAGATAARVAADCGLSAAHTRRCLHRLRDAGFVESSKEIVMWGYAPRRARLWRLAMSERTLDALPQIGWLPPAESDTPPDSVPPEFWYLFWSGECASRLRLPDDAVHVADTLIGGPDGPARTWALTRLPLSALRRLATMRGYDSGPLAERLNVAIQHRSRG